MYGHAAWADQVLNADLQTGGKFWYPGLATTSPAVDVLENVSMELGNVCRAECNTIIRNHMPLDTYFLPHS